MPDINSDDRDILDTAESKHFKYAFLYGLDEGCILCYGERGLKDFTDIVESIIYDGDFFDDDMYEMTYPGDRESPPEYSLIDDAEARCVIEQYKVDGDYWHLEFAPNESGIYLFNTTNACEKILKENDFTLQDLLNGNIEINPKSIYSELFEVDSDLVDELRDLFN